MENVTPNVITDFCSRRSYPIIDNTAYIHPQSSVIGNVYIGKKVMVCPFAAIRGDEGQPIYVGSDTNVQDGVVLHGLETESDGTVVAANLVDVGNHKMSIYIGMRVSLAHQSQVHGPAKIGNDTFIGMQSLVFKAEVGDNCVVEPGCIVMGVTVADNRYVPAGSVLRSQSEADNLPEIDENYPLKDLNKGVVHVNTRLAVAYAAG